MNWYLILVFVLVVLGSAYLALKSMDDFAAPILSLRRRLSGVIIFTRQGIFHYRVRLPALRLGGGS